MIAQCTTMQCRRMPAFDVKSQVGDGDGVGVSRPLSLGLYVRASLSLFFIFAADVVLDVQLFMLMLQFISIYQSRRCC